MRRTKLALLLVLRAAGAFRLCRRLTRDRLKILCYHGFELHDETAFRPALFMKRETFAQRLEILERYGFRVVPLDEAVRRLYAGTLEDDSMVITVDDGFQSVLVAAVPELWRFRFPATVYVTSYYVQHANPVFRLAVQYMFWKTRAHELPLSDVPWSNESVVALDDADAANRAMWDCISHGEQQCDEAGRQEMCELLGDRLGVPFEEIVRSRILHLMTPDELRTLSGSDVSVELHTHRHRFPAADETSARREIADNRAALGQWITGEKSHFCYPSGEWNSRQWDWLDRMQVLSATTCDPGLNSRSTPRHALRRFLDGQNVHALEFEAAVCGLFDLVRSARARLRA